MSKDSTKPGPLSMKDLEPMARRGADQAREDAERRAFAIPDGRHRRKIGRTEPLSLRTFPEIKQAILDMADAEGKSFVEIVEDAVRMRQRQMKGERLSGR